MKLWSDSFRHGERIPDEFVFAVFDPENHVALSLNRNPHFAWSDLPEGTESLVLLIHDSDVPSIGDDVNQEGKTVSASLPRVDFFHWILLDIPPSQDHILAGDYSEGITPKGKSGPELTNGLRQGLNTYTQWFEGDVDMGGQYYGYDGPCPPWNDEIIHHYHFTLYALNIRRTPLEHGLTGDAVRQAIKPYIIGEASYMGIYSINPDAK